MLYMVIGDHLITFQSSQQRVKYLILNVPPMWKISSHMKSSTQFFFYIYTQYASMNFILHTLHHSAHFAELLKHEYLIFLSQ